MRGRWVTLHLPATDPNGVNVVGLLSASTNARLLWDPDSGPTCAKGEGTAGGGRLQSPPG